MNPGLASADEVLALQRTAGNRGVAGALHRQPTAPPEAPPAADNVATLDEYLDRLNTPEGDVIDLLAKMTPAEKATVLAGYRDRLAGCLDFGEMKRALANLGPPLPVRLDWLEKSVALGMTSLISYDEISDLVTAAPQAERDMLKNARWQSFFTSVCTNDTIIPAVRDLGWDLVTQLNWVRGEASALLSLDLDKLRPLLTGRAPADLAAVSGDDWLPFWTDVCTNTTMPDLVQILFPNDLVKQLHFMIDEGTDAEKVTARITAMPADQRLRVYDSAEASQLIRTFEPAQQIAIVQLLTGTPLQQLTLLGPVVPLSLLTWATASQEWVDALVATRADPVEVVTLAGSNLAWAPFLQPKLAQLFRGKDATAYGTDVVNMIWAAYGDGSTFSSADTLVVFRALFGRDVESPGDVTFTTGPLSRERYRAVAPDDASARELMRMVKTIPRSQVAAAPIAFCDTGWKETFGLFSGWTGPVNASFTTSFFWQDRIIIKVSATGAMDSSQVGTLAGEGTAYGAPGTTGPGGTAYTGSTALSYFQNHVRHEIGHAVGQKTIGTMSESGDEFADAYGGWKSSSESAFTAAMWAPVAQPAAGWPSLDFGGGAVAVDDTQVRDWLVGLLSSAAEVAGPIKNGTNAMRQKLATLAGSIWSSQRLTQQLNAAPGNDPKAIQDSAYMFPGFTPPDPVHMYATRDGDRFMTYTKAAHDNLHVTTGWYSLSSHKEMFAEMYTRKYSGGGTPPAVNGKDPATFFTELEKQEDPMFGQPAPDAPAGP